MTPRTARPDVRDALIDEAAKVLREQGAAALSARKLAASVGTSTTAVYTHFGGMDEVRRAVRMKAFAQVAEWLERVPVTDDPVADMAALGAAYVGNARANPNLYRALFLDEVMSDEERDLCLATFARMTDAVQRCIDSGIVERRDGWEMAMEFWAATHGVVSLLIAEMWSDEEALVRMAGLGQTMLAGLGVSRERAARALAYSAAFIVPGQGR